MKAIIEIRKFGTIKVELYPEVAPITVENFAKLSKKGFYQLVNAPFNRATHSMHCTKDKVVAQPPKCDGNEENTP